jgi:UDPglucose--hexose-1-phosphate uridylyltransferase
MTSFRQDATTNEWVIVTPQRSRRPRAAEAPGRAEGPPHDGACPFCPGNEHMTPPEVLRHPEGRWEQRVVPNLFPAVESRGTTERRGAPEGREMDGVGSHEVVVESPIHNERMDEMKEERIEDILRVWRSRYRELKRDPLVRAVSVFKNFGERAGTSLSHPHSQIVALSVLPPDALRGFAVATRYFDDTGHNLYMDLVDRERREGARVVMEGPGFISFTPFAARVPFETWIVPTVEEGSFERVADEALPELAATIGRLLGALRMAAEDPDFNLIVQSAPDVEESNPFFVWHLRLLPRISTPAGFELGTGMSINPVEPEDAARRLREALATVPAS